MSRMAVESFVDSPKWFGDTQGQETFPVAGWVASRKRVEQVVVTVNGTALDADLVGRPDVEAVHGSRYGHVTGYRALVPTPEGDCSITIDYFYRDGSLAKSEELRFDVSALAMERPDFLGIGAQKAGTTWLYENLSRHGDIYFPRKEVHFFNRRREIERGIEHYFRMFGPGGERIKGEITPEYCFLPAPRIGFIRDVLPDVRIVFLMRHPIERSWSGHMMHCLHYLKRDYGSMSREEKLLPLIRETSGVYMMSDYYTILRNWFAAFPRESILVEFHDNIKRDPDAVFTAVLRHIGAEVPEDLSSFPLRKVFQPTFAGFFDQRIPKPPIPEDMIPDLQRVYFPMIERLKTLIRSDVLDEWLRWPS